MVRYHRPTTLDDALAIRADGPVTVLAGGTDVYPARSVDVVWGDPAVRDILDISAIGGLRGISGDETGWTIGAATTWTDIIRADLPPRFDGLKQAAREVGGVQIQNRGTIAGNLCTASPAGDGIPCLMALDAMVVLSSLSGERALPLPDFVTGYRETALQRDELVTAIRIPTSSANAVSGFVKLGARRYLVISIVMVAGVLEFDRSGSITNARIAVGACSPTARRISELERRLVGLNMANVLSAQVQADDLADLAPVDDIRASATFRRAAAQSALRDLLDGLGRGRREVAA